MKPATTKNILGFTLIELLVVISLIGILATLVMANLNAGRGRSRDAQRKSDMRNIATALRLYYNDRGAFPTNNTDGEIVACGSYTSPVACEWGEPWAVGTTTYMPILPDDSLEDQVYKYEVSSDRDSFTLEACLENKSDDKGVSTNETSWCTSAWEYVLTQ
jgi:type II secretion system protein G